MGDTAFLTKPTCGEGCTSSLEHGEIAVDVIGKLLKEGKALTKENMWSINSRYLRGQGKSFDSMRALLKGVITISYDEAEYMFNNELLFSPKILGGIDDGLKLGVGDIAKIVGGIVKGIDTKKIRGSTVKNLLKALNQSGAVTKLYDTYPENYEGFSEWKAKADKLWAEIGKLSDIIDEEIAKKVNM
jgi:flavin-dependent dehydrogenase